MNTTDSKSLLDYINNHSFVSISNATSAIAVALLLAVLIEREVLRMSRPEAARRNVVAFASVVIPTAAIFAAVIMVRFIKLS